MSVRSEVIRLLDVVTVLGNRNFADERPEGEALPHTVVLDAITFNNQLLGDGRVMYWRHIAQVDLWEDAAAASQTTRDAVVAALDGQPVTGSMKLRVESAARVYEPDRRLAHTVISVACSRQLTLADPDPP